MDFSTTISNRYSTGVPGIEILERVSTSNFTQPRRGVGCMIGVLKRGPEGVLFPVTSLDSYHRMCGDPNDALWHLFAKGDHILPDCIEGFFRNSGGAGMLWLARPDLKGRKASLRLKNRLGDDTLLLEAASSGRWAGSDNVLDKTKVVFATARTFTVIAPGVLVNEFEDGEVVFDTVAGKRFKIVANTAADPRTGSVVFTVSPQHNLVRENVLGPTPLTGTASFENFADQGTISFNPRANVTGTAFTVDGISITGTGSAFLTQMRVGDTIYINETETRIVVGIASATRLSLNAAPSIDFINSLKINNRVVTGTLTTFTTDFAVGEDIYVQTESGDYERRKIETITSATALTLVTGFDTVLTDQTCFKKNLVVTVTDGDLIDELREGDYISDPNDFHHLVRVDTINSATSFTLEEAFIGPITALKISKIQESARVEFKSGDALEGLSVVVSQGKRYPATHFGLSVYFRGYEVMNLDDASLDPADPLFVETLVADNNIAYRTGTNNYYRWLTAKSLATGTYTTNMEDDVRPSNGAGTILSIEDNRLYSVSTIFDYKATINNYLFPNPYKLPRSYFRVKDAENPLQIDGTISVVGTTVTGTNTEFTTELSAGDYIYDSVNDIARKVLYIISDGSLVLESAFPANFTNQTTYRLGYLEVERSYDLSDYCAKGDRFLLSFMSKLSRGYDGDLSNISSYDYTKYADVDLNVIENSVFGLNMGMLRIAVPGVSDPYIQKQFINYCELKAYEFRAEIPLNYSTASLAESFINLDLGRSNCLSVAWPSYGYIQNPVGAGDRLIPLTGEIFGGESNRSLSADGWHQPFAGVSARMPRIRKLPYQVDLRSQELINAAGIQPIRQISGGIVVFGARCPAVNEVFDYLHIARTQREYVRLFLEAPLLLEKLFSPKDPSVIEHLIMSLNKFGEREHKKGALDRRLTFSAAVQVGLADENSGVGSVTFDRGKISVFFSYRPPEIIEVISLNCSPQGVSLNTSRGASNYSNSQAA